MKLTVDQLRQIIREEVQKVVSESSETESLTEATREPSNLTRDLRRLPVGGRIEGVNLFDFGKDGIKADIEKRLVGGRRVYALIKLNRNGNPKSEEVFDTAEKLAYSLGDFSYF